MPTFPLAPHPRTPCAAAHAVDVAIEPRPRGRLALCYAIRGEIAGLRLPAPAAPVRTDGLWRHTCFEVFVRCAGRPAYVEWNIAPSGEWAAYRFEAYRRGMAPLEPVATPRALVHAAADRLELAVTLDLRPLVAASVEPVEVAVSAVIEAQDGRLSYWALRHGPEQPDFHHTDGFALALRPDRAGAVGIARI